MTAPAPTELRLETHFDARSVLCYAQRPVNLVRLFDQAIARAPAADALIDERRRLSYRDLDVLADGAAAALTGRGVARGDRIVLLTGNCAEFCIVALGAWRAGLIIVPLNPRNVRDEVAFVLNQCGARALIHEAWLADRAPLPGQADGCAQVLEVAALVDFAAVDATVDAAAVPPRHDAGEEDVAVLLYTSGTTGRPKGAMLTHLNMIHSVLHFTTGMRLEEQRERSLLAVPISHVTGLVAIWLSMARVAGAMVMMRDFKASPCLELLARERVTHTVLVPAIYNLLLREPRFARHDLSQWRIGSFGGAPMPEPTIEALAQVLPGLTLMNAYGATETASPVTLMPIGQQRANLDSVGRVLPCARVRIVDDGGRDLPAGAAGELWIAGPMVVPGYWDNPKATASEFVDGHWKSGDIGSIDANGFVRVFDRKKDMINRGGYKVYSAEVESVLIGHPRVLEAAVVGQPDPVLGERSHAYVVLRDAAGSAGEGTAGDTLDPLDPDRLRAAIRAHCAEHLADYKVPDFVSLRNEPLPRNPNGKVLKRRLRDA